MDLLAGAALGLTRRARIDRNTNRGLSRATKPVYTRNMTRTSPGFPLTGAVLDLASRLAARSLFSTFPDPRDTFSLTVEGGDALVVSVDDDAFDPAIVRIFASQLEFNAFDDALDAREVDGIEIESPSHLRLTLGDRHDGPSHLKTAVGAVPEASRITVGGESTAPSAGDLEKVELVVRALLVVTDDEVAEDIWDGDILRDKRPQTPILRELGLDTPSGPRSVTVAAPVTVPSRGLLGDLETTFAAGGEAYADAVRAFVDAVATSPEGAAFGAPLTAIPYVLSMAREAWECPLPRLRPNHLRDLVLGILPEHGGPVSAELRAHPEKAAIFVEELRVLYRYLGRAYGYERADAMLRVLRDSSVAYLENALRECAVALATIRREAKAKLATSAAAHRAKKAKRKAESKAKRKNR